MATVLERDLIPSLSREVGDSISPYYYTKDQLFSAINDGKDDFNEVMFQQYDVTGSGDTAAFTPDPDAEDKRLIILFSAVALLRGSMVKFGREAVVHSNVAGRTDLTARAEWLDKTILRLEKKISKIRNMRAKALVDDKLDDEAAMELRNNLTGGSSSPEGTTIVTITKSK